MIFNWPGIACSCRLRASGCPDFDRGGEPGWAAVHANKQTQTVPWSQFNSLALNGTFVDSRWQTCCSCCCSCSFWAVLRWSGGTSWQGVTETGVMAFTSEPAFTLALQWSWLVISCKALLCCRVSYCFLIVRRCSVSISANGVSKLQAGKRQRNPPTCQCPQSMLVKQNSWGAANKQKQSSSTWMTENIRRHPAMFWVGLDTFVLLLGTVQNIFWCV